MEKYQYYSTFYYKEELRTYNIIFNDNAIDYKLTPKSDHVHARAPLSGYFEMEVYISENDFDKAAKLISEMDE
jgi:hypothetical protein